MSSPKRRSATCLWLLLLILTYPNTGSCDPTSASLFSKFELRWVYKNVPIQFKLFALPKGQNRNNGEMGTIKKIEDLKLGPAITDGKVEVQKSIKQRYFLIAENKTAFPIRFAVAPHSTNPPETSLGFQFKCLCNGHVYTIPPHSFWYRVIALQTSQTMTDQIIVLTHTVFAPPETAMNSEKQN